MRPGPPVLAARSREEDLHARVVPATRFQQPDLRRDVGPQVGEGVFQAVDVADLPDEIEDVLELLDQRAHRLEIAESVMTGNIRFEIPPQRAGGSQNSQREKTITRIGPSTKFGTESPSIAPVIEA